MDPKLSYDESISNKYKKEKKMRKKRVKRTRQQKQKWNLKLKEIHNGK